MTWYPTSFHPYQYVNPITKAPYSGAVLKCYAQETSNVISMATSYTGVSVATSFTLNAGGYPVSSVGNVIIPHVQEDFKMALYPDQASADADSGAIWTVDDNQIAVTSNEPFFQAFSGDGATGVFTLSEDLGTDETTIMVFASQPHEECSTNGTFATASGWTLGANWSYGTNQAQAVGATSNLSQPAGVAILQGEEYVLKYTMTSEEYTQNGTFNGSAASWTLNTGWAYGTNNIVATTATSAATETAGFTINNGTTYTITIVMESTAGTLTPSIGGTAGTAIPITSGTTKTITQQITVAAGTQAITLTGAGFTGIVTSVSVTAGNVVPKLGGQALDTPIYSGGSYTHKIVAGATQTLEFDATTFTGNISAVSLHKAVAARRQILNPSEYTLSHTQLTLNNIPITATNDILVFAPSLLFGAVGNAAAAAATSEANALSYMNQTLAALNTVNAWTTNVDADSPVTMAANTNYEANSAATLLLYDLPLTPTDGQVSRIGGVGAAGWKITQRLGEQIIFGSVSTTSGVTGYLASSNRYDEITLRYSGAAACWKVMSAVGAISWN